MFDSLKTDAEISTISEISKATEIFIYPKFLLRQKFLRIQLPQYKRLVSSEKFVGSKFSEGGAILTQENLRVQKLEVG